MIRLMWRLVRALAALLVLGGALYLGGPYLLAHAGRYLIAEDPVTKGDMAVVLSGQPYLCVPEAARLYHERLATKILLFNAPRPPGQEDLLRVGTRYPMRWSSLCSSWRRSEFLARPSSRSRSAPTTSGPRRIWCRASSQADPPERSSWSRRKPKQFGLARSLGKSWGRRSPW